MVFLDSSMVIQLLIPIVWLFGRLNSEIFPMVQPSLLTTLLSADKPSGRNSQELCFLFLMEWMDRDLNTVREEYKDFYNFLMMFVMRINL